MTAIATQSRLAAALLFGLGAASGGPTIAVHASEFAAFKTAIAPSGLAPATSLDGAPLSIGGDPTRVTLVHFFASWCEPCAEELLALARFVKDRSGEMRLVGVAVAEPASRARTFAARFDLPGEIASDADKTIVAAYGVRGLPATVALAPDGRALLAAGPLDWTSAEVAATLSTLKNKP